MRAREWLLGGAAVAVLTVALPERAGAEDRRFTSYMMDTNRSYRIIYAPIWLTRLTPEPDSEIPGIAARWTQVALQDQEFDVDEAVRGPYRLLALTVKRDPEQPTAPPEIDIVIEQEGRLPEGAPPPRIVLLDTDTKLESRQVADVLRLEGRTLYRVEVLPPKAGLHPEGHRFYLNPGDRYEVQLLRGVRERVAGTREVLPTFGEFETLPTFGPVDPRWMDTGRPRRRRR